MNKQFNFIAFATTLITCMTIAFGWGLFCVDNNINDITRGIVSFCIGLFGSKVIYSWLCTPDIKDKELGPPEL